MNGQPLAVGEPGCADHRDVVCTILCGMLDRARDAGHNRNAIAGLATIYAGSTISKFMLDAYTSLSRRGFNLPLHLVPAIELACGGDRSLTAWLAGAAGGAFAPSSDVPALTFGRMAFERERLRKAMLELAAARLGEVAEPEAP